MTLLRGGHETIDPRLDRIYPGVEPHLSSLRYLVSEMPLAYKPFRSYTRTLSFWLDQGQEGRCVEYGFCHEMLATPKPIPPSVVDDVLAHKKIYWPAQREDWWPGGSYPGASPFYEGTSVLAGARVAARYGFYGEYRWAMNVEEMALAVGYGGPVVIGVNWYGGFMRPDVDGWIFIGNSAVAGGHCVCVTGVTVRRNSDGSINYDKSYFTIRNSWGRDWGLNGGCKLSWRDMERLIHERGEVMLPTVRNLVKVPVMSL